MVADPQTVVRQSLYKYWKEAILNIEKAGYWLEEILKKDRNLAYQWLRKHIQETDTPYEMQKLFRNAIAPLSIEERKEILKLLPESYWRSGFIRGLIGESPELYSALLQDKSKEELHLIPLSGFGVDDVGEESWEEEKWVTKAKLALDAGYTPEDVADAIYGKSYSWQGRISSMWARWMDRYEKLSNNSDPRIKQAGEIGKAKAKANYEKALAEERREDIYGR
jgi:hypothetical protein